MDVNSNDEDDKRGNNLSVETFLLVALILYNIVSLWQCHDNAMMTKIMTHFDQWKRHNLALHENVA